MYDNDYITSLALSNHKASYSTIKIEASNVSEGLRDKIPSWFNHFGYSDPILINAPTGMGKSYFVLNDLAGFAKARNEKVLLLTNRSVLSWQLKIQTIEKQNDFELSLDSLNEIIHLGNIIITTYQSFSSYKNNLLYSNIKFVVLDEIHFFFSDAVFNANTCNILREILSFSVNKVRIYMSATPKDVKPLLACEEYLLSDYLKNYRGDSASSIQISASTLNNTIIEYVFPASPLNIDLKFFNEWETIIDIINCSDSNEKWLIFVGNKETGKFLNSKIKNSKYVDASTKDRVNTSLVWIEKLAEKVLISTSVLDNGINFKDDDLKYIVIDSTDQAQMMQMFGRKRRRKDEKVAVYVMNKSKDDISRLKVDAASKNKFLREFRKNPYMLLAQKWGSFNEAEQKLINIEHIPLPQEIIVQLSTNEHAAFYCSRSEGKYSKLEALFDGIGDTAFAQKVCEWFGIKFSVDMVLDGIVSEAEIEKIREKVLSLINNHLDKPFDSSTAEWIMETLKKTIKPILKDIDIEKYKDNEHFTGNIKKIFSYLSIDYHIRKTTNKNEWTIVKKKKADDTVNSDDTPAE